MVGTARSNFFGWMEGEEGSPASPLLSLLLELTGGCADMRRGELVSRTILIPTCNQVVSHETSENHPCNRFC